MLKYKRFLYKNLLKLFIIIMFFFFIIIEIKNLKIFS